MLGKFASGLLGELKNVASEMDRQQSRKRELEGELANLTGVLASGQLSSTIMIAIAEREISEITERMFSSSEDSIRSRIAAMRTTAKSKLRDLRGLPGRDVTVARSALSNHIDKIEMGADGKVYVAGGGNCNFLGNDLGMVPGARIELATPAFSGRRSTTELPRHVIYKV